MEPAVLTVLVEYAKVLAIVLASLAMGWVLSRMPAQAAKRIGPWAELGGTVIVAWLGLAKLGWTIQTWGAETLAERVNEGIFRWGTAIGLVLLFFESFRKRRALLPEASPGNGPE